MNDNAIMDVRIEIPNYIWDAILAEADQRMIASKLVKPIVYALYTTELEHKKVIECKEITTVKVRGNYPDSEYDYTYPGIKKLGFYPPKGGNRWFSGTLVIGDGMELCEEDKKWMIFETLDFRIKVDKDTAGKWCWKAYYLEFLNAQVNFK